MKVSVINYGMGNLGSVVRALEKLGVETFIASIPSEIKNADKLILPGVGSFFDGMRLLRKNGWVDVIHEQVLVADKHLLGICLGMQLLATSGTEGGNTQGLNLIPGKVDHLKMMGCNHRLPHVGWEEISPVSSNQNLLSGIPNGTDFYFVHSYAFEPENEGTVLASTMYGIPITAAIGSGKVFGTQFHPEKSSKAGFRVLKNFLEL